MRSLFALSWALVGAVVMASCGSSADEEAGGSEDLPAAAEAGMPAPEATGEITCWLQNATPEEAAQRPSPLGETEIILDGHVGKICYGRPSARGRVVEGGLIPFGSPWRLGANEATALHLPFPVTVGGVQLEPGSYSLFAIAGESEWTLVLNSVAERWGIPINDEVRATDVGSFSATPEMLPEPVEHFTIRWAAEGQGSGRLLMDWGTTRVGVDVRLRGASD